MEQHAINWFEISVANFDRAKKFYSAIFEYDMPVQDMGEFLMGYLPSTDTPNSVGGAICASDFHKPSATGAIVYLNGGNDLTTILNRIEHAGGKIITPKTQITPEIGYMAFFTDSEGNTLALHSPN